MLKPRPKLSLAKAAFKEVYDDIGKSVSAVGTKIGGKIDYNINTVPAGQGRFENACAIRLSYVINKCSHKIPYIAGQVSSGQQGNWYIFRVKTMIQYLEKAFGKADHSFDNPTAQDLSTHKGILVFEVDSWSDASGHATIWDGLHCSDKCYFPISQKAHLWTLKN